MSSNAQSRRPGSRFGLSMPDLPGLRIPSGVPSVVSPRSMGILFVAAAMPMAFRNSPTTEAAAEAQTEALSLSSQFSASLPDNSPLAALPTEGRERVEYWMHRFTTDQRATFEVFITQEGAFGDLIREKLQTREMPEELIYLAMIESGLRPMATSRVQAAGVWQFMGPTAEAYGLRVDPWVDERRDPVKATDAALDYLEFLHAQYDSWYLAAAAYNAGPTRVNRILRRRGLHGQTSDQTYWDIRSDLPRETREYVPRMLAASYLAAKLHENGFHAVQPESPYVFDQVWVPGRTHLDQVAQGIGTSEDVLWALNPHLIQGRTPPGEAYPLRVPVGTAFQVVAAMGERSWSPYGTDEPTG